MALVLGIGLGGALAQVQIVSSTLALGVGGACIAIGWLLSGISGWYARNCSWACVESGCHAYTHSTSSLQGKTRSCLRVVCISSLPSSRRYFLATRGTSMRVFASLFTNMGSLRVMISTRLICFLCLPAGHLELCKLREQSSQMLGGSLCLCARAPRSPWTNQSTDCC